MKNFMHLYFQFILCILCAIAQSARRANIMDMESSNSNPLALNDSRADGISFEINQAILNTHLRETGSVGDLDSFALSGLHNVKLEFGDVYISKRSNIFLEYLASLHVSPESSWSIEITGTDYDNPKLNSLNSILLLKFLSRVPRLSSMSWSNERPIDPAVLRLMEIKHPSCRLYYEMPFYWLGSSRHHLIYDEQEYTLIEPIAPGKTTGHRLSVLESIMNSTVLYSLKTALVNGREPNPKYLDLVLRILTSCPNVRELELSVKRGGGCVVVPGQPYAFNFLESNATLPPLEVLSIDGYRFGAKPNGHDWMEWEAEHPQRNILSSPWKYFPDSVVEYVGYPRIHSLGGLSSSFVKRDSSALAPSTETNLDLWLQRMDWTHIRILKLNDPPAALLESIAGDVLPRLQNVEFSGFNHHAILQFLSSTILPLRSVHFNGVYFCSLDDLVNTVVTHHGSALRNFAYKHRQVRRQHYYNSRKSKSYKHPTSSFVSSSQLETLRDGCPRLASLDIDIEAVTEWNYSVFDAVTAFTELEHLTLRFDASENLRDYDEFPGFYEESDSERADQEVIMIGLATYLRKHKSGKQFTKLETWVGESNIRNTLR